MKTSLYKKMSLVDTIISVICVTDNDEDIIKDRLTAIHQVLSKLKVNYEILVVDNDSNDNTINVIKNLRRVMLHARILVLSKKYDTEIASTAGLDNCVGDYAIFFDIYTAPPEAIQNLIDKLIDGKDIIIGKGTHEVINLDLLSKFFLYLVEKLSSQGFHYRQNYLIGLNRKAINSILRIRRKSRSFSYINSLIGFKKGNVEYKPLKQFKYKLKDSSFFEILFIIADTIISNSFRPIRILSFAGMFFSMLFLLYVLGIVILVIFFGMKNIAPQGWISVATVISTMFFLLFSLLTLISEYIIRILSESRNEPFYFVSEEINQSVILPKKRMLNIT